MYILSARQLLTLFLAFVIGISARADELTPDGVQNLLTGISRSLHEQNFDALITYEHSGFLDSLRWQHWYEDGRESASLQRLNGPLHAPELQSLPADCLSLADRLMRGELQPFGDAAGGLTQSYRFVALPSERVGGRIADVVVVVPLDQYRFGYNLAIDQQTGIPLRIMTIGTDNRVLERFEVVELRVPAQPPAAAMSAPASACRLPTDAHGVPWVLSWVPSGFVLVGAATATAAGDMLVYSDGFSFVSVFVRAGPLLASAQARAQRGATNVYMEQLTFDGQPHLITVVGEVPFNSSSRMAASVQRRVMATSQ